MGDPKFTPGPWRWKISLHARQAQLCGGARPQYDLTVMDFVRWGMSGAAPRFLYPSNPGQPGHMLLDRCEKWAAIVPGREHHAAWFQTLDHPDARLIAAAPDLYAALKTLHDNCAEYIRINNLYRGDGSSAVENQDMQQARAALAKADGLLPLAHPESNRG